MCRQADPFQVFGDVEIGFVERQGLDDGRVFSEDFADLQRDCFVSVKTRLDKDQVGAFSLGVIDGIAE